MILFLKMSSLSSENNYCEFYCYSKVFHYPLHPLNLHGACEKDQNIPLLPVVAGFRILMPPIIAAG